jgi:hypothetical protein
MTCAEAFTERKRMLYLFAEARIRRSRSSVP